jgi:hypothetical protein
LLYSALVVFRTKPEAFGGKNLDVVAPQPRKVHPSEGFESAFCGRANPAVFQPVNCALDGLLYVGCSDRGDREPVGTIASVKRGVIGLPDERFRILVV